MISKTKVTIILSLLLFIFLIFFIWYFYFNIYEVEFASDFSPPELELNKIYKIQSIGINALGMRLKFRDTDLTYRIEKGDSLIKIHSSSDKNSLIFSLVDYGEIEILIDSKFSLNPSKIRLSSKDSNEK